LSDIPPTPGHGPQRFQEINKLPVIERPEDPDVPAMLERIRRWRDGYLHWGRETLGFGVYLFHRPAAR